jgi:hypothetical protein
MFDVNTDASIILTAKLERLSKSAFPSAVRSTINDAAFEMKKSNILDSAKRNMTVRNPSFFKKFTGVKRASGFNVSSMYAEVGFKNTDPNPIKGRKAIEGMEHNEEGGSDNTGAMYLGKARTSNTLKKLVRRKSRFDKSKLVKGRVRTKKSVSNTMNMISSFEEKKPTLINSKKGKFLVQVVGMTHNYVTNKSEFKLEFLMRDRKKYKATAKATHFNQEAAIKTSKQIEGFYVKNAEFQFNKILKSTR